MVSNKFLISQFQMKTGHFEESIKSIEETFVLLEKSKDDFNKEDHEVVYAKFYLQQANSNFIAGHYGAAMEAAKNSLTNIDNLKNTDMNVVRQMVNLKRDAKNCAIRAQAKHEGKTAVDVRR